MKRTWHEQGTGPWVGPAIPVFLVGLTAGILYAFWMPWFKIAPLLLLVTLTAWVFLKNRVLLLWLVVGLAVGFLDARVQTPSVPESPPESPVTLDGRVSGFTEIRSDRIRFVMSSRGYGRVRVTVPRTTVVACGDRVQVRGSLKAIRGFLNPGVFNPASRTRREGIFFRLYTEEVHVLAEGPVVFRRLDLLRRALINHFEESFPKDRALLLKAVLLGVADMPDDLRDDFSRSGAAHLLAVSGTHLSLLGLVLFFFIRGILIRLPHRFYLRLSQNLSATGIAVLAVLPVLVFYCGLSGSRIPTIRSLIMILAFLVATLLGRHRSWMRVVCLAAALLLVAQPHALLDLSFQFTFLAVVVICLGMGRKQTHEGGLPAKAAEGSRRLLPDYFKTLFLTSVAATLGLAPLTALYFNNISLVAPLTNLVAMPLAGFLVIPLGLLHVLFHATLGLDVLAGAVDMAGRILLAVVGFFSALPGAAVSLSSPPAWSVLACYLVFGTLYRFRAPALLFLLTPALLFYPSMPAQPEVNLLDVGQGLCTVVRLPDGGVVLFDTGGLRNYDVAGSIIKPFLRSRGISRIDLIVLSHAHPDHIGGLEGVISGVTVSEVWSNGEPSDELTRIRLSHPQTVFRTVRRGEHMEGKDFRLTVIHPDREYLALHPQGKRDHRNDSSLVTRLSLFGCSFLFPGDIRKSGEAWVVERQRGELDSDILVVPHHGGKHAASKDFLEAVSPKYALISAGYGNRFGHPRSETLSRLLASGSIIYRTDLSGAVVVDHLKNPFAPRFRVYRDFQLRSRETMDDEWVNLRLALGLGG